MEHRDVVFQKHAKHAAKSCVNNPPLQKARHRMQLPECTFSNAPPPAPAANRKEAVAPAPVVVALPTVAHVLEHAYYGHSSTAKKKQKTTAPVDTVTDTGADSAGRKANLYRQLRAEGISSIIGSARGLLPALEAMLEAPLADRAPFLLLDVDGSAGLGCGFRARLRGVLGSADRSQSGSSRCGLAALGPRGSGVLLLSGGSRVTHADTMPNRFNLPLQQFNETAGLRCFNLAASDNGQNCVAGLYSRAALEVLVRWHREHPKGTACEGLLHISDLGHITRVLTTSATMQAHRAVALVDGGGGDVVGCRSN